MGFVKGQSGNVKGRPPRTDSEKRQRAQIRKALPEIIERLIDLALDGDTTASKLLLERVMPTLKSMDRAVTMDLGDDLADAGRAILTALGSGSVTPDQAATLASTIGTLARVNEMIAIETRLAKIEKILDERKP